MVSIKPVIEKLEDLFMAFNERYYNGELEKPVITVAQDITSGAYGWATSWRAWKKGGSDDQGYYEINMCAEHLTRPFEDICSTMLHEMVHIWNLQHGVKDTSRGGKYHNKRFKVEAEQRGLIISQGDKYGWHITELNDDAKEFVKSMEHDGFELYRPKVVKASKAGSSSKSSSRKYVCPECGLIVRATKDARILCGDCGIELELEGDR